MNAKSLLTTVMASTALVCFCVKQPAGIVRDNPYDAGGSNWIFNHPPANPIVSAPTSNISWVSFNWSTGRGTLPLTMSASDADLPYDTLAFTLFTGPSAASLTQVYSGRSAVYNLLDVDTSAVVYWKLAVRDLFGDSAIDSGSCIAPSSPILFFEDFEGSYAGWTLTGNWQVGTPSYVGPSAAYQGTRCAGTIINGNYYNSTISYLTSPAVTISATSTHATLSYYEWYSTESCCDYMYVDISTNGGSSWTSLQSGRNGTNTSWTQRTFDLSSYRGTTIRLRFTFSTDGSVVYPGWYIDNLSIIP